MSNKFNFSKDAKTLKNGDTLDITIIKSKDNKKLIKYDEITKLVNGLKTKGVDIKNNFRIIASSQVQPYTIKSQGEDYDPDYMRNKAEDVERALNGYFEVHIIKTIPKNKK